MYMYVIQVHISFNDARPGPVVLINKITLKECQIKKWPDQPDYYDFVASTPYFSIFLLNISDHITLFLTSSNSMLTAFVA